MSFGRFLVLTVAALAATTSPAVAERNTPTFGVGRRVSSQVGDVATTLKKQAAIAPVAKVPKGGVDAAFISQPASILMGFILALNSGFINGCALSGAVTIDGSSQAVAAVTASWTNSALGLAAGNMAKFGFLGKILLSFISGSFIAGYLQPNPTPFLVSSSSFGLPLVIAAACTILAKNYFGDASSVKLGFCLLAVANGINNSVTSTMTSNLCRTSHFTGISSDIGSFLGQVLRGNKANLFKLKVFMGLAACFWGGGYLSYGLSKAHGTDVMYIAAAVYLFMAGGYDKVAKSIFA